MKNSQYLNRIWKSIVVISIFGLFFNTLLAQDNCYGATANDIEFNSSGGTLQSTIELPSGCSDGTWTLSGVPSWISSASISGLTVSVSVPTYSGYERSGGISLSRNGAIFGGLTVFQNKGNTPPCIVSSSLSATFSSDGEELTFPITYSNCSSNIQDTFEIKQLGGASLPVWAVVTKNGPDEIKIRVNANEEQGSRILYLNGFGNNYPELYISGELMQSCNLQTWYKDKDGDGWADDAIGAVSQCSKPQPNAWYKLSVTGLGDCNDDDPQMNPGTVWYRDTDGDNYKDQGGEIREACIMPTDGNWTDTPESIDDVCPNKPFSSNNGCPPPCTFELTSNSFDPDAIAAGGFYYLSFNISGGSSANINVVLDPICIGVNTINVVKHEDNVDDDWFTINTATSNPFTIQCNPNTGATRSAQVKVIVNNEPTTIRTFYVEQEGTLPPIECNMIAKLDGQVISNNYNVILDAHGDSKLLDISFDNINCNKAVNIFNPTGDNYDSWLTIISSSGNNFRLEVNANETGGNNNAILGVGVEGDDEQDFFFTVAQPTCLKTWYPDTDGDSYGDVYAFGEISCTRPDYGDEIIWVDNNNDLCPEIYGLFSGCPTQADIPENWNTVTSRSFDITETLKGAGKVYYDDLGKAVQSHSLDTKTNKIWLTETFYDSQGRPAVGTLSAPIEKTSTTGTNFEHVAEFTLNGSGNAFSASDFENDPENPASVVNEEGTLGWYYSNTNTDEPYQDITDRPYSRTIYSELNPGAVLKTIGGNKVADTDEDGDIDDDDEWIQAYTFSMRASQELSQPKAFREIATETNPTKYDDYKIVKTVSRDVHGVENVVFTDTDGKTLAAARSGKEGIKRGMSIDIGEQGYLDIHVPAGEEGEQLGFTVSANGNAYKVYDLITETTVSASIGLPNGFYRVAVDNPDTYDYENEEVTVNYHSKYYDYALNEYDEVGRLIASYQPLNKLKTEYKYNTLGQLIETTSPDEGTAKFMYRDDGQIRFSQNTKQLGPEREGNLLAEEFSYTNYDTFGRPIQSGVCTDGGFDGLRPNKTVVVAVKEVNYTTYDSLDPTELATLPTNYRTPAFLAGNVAKTSNDQTTTYYSYDIYGRVQWVVQDIVDIGFKTIDYEYDPITSQVKRVIYQKGNTAEQFIHRYTYDSDDNSLTMVETSTNGSNYTTHATYAYYETGALKSTSFAPSIENPEGIQTQEYVYNLAGQLKAINPNALTANANNAPLFGMQLDYHRNDYNRATTNITSPIYGEDQVNGNIKGVRWKNSQNALGVTEELKYAYTYDRNNWLKSADFGADGIAETTTIDPLILANEVVEDGQDRVYENPTSITIKPNSHFKSGSNVLLRINSASAEAGGEYDVSNITYDANGNIRALIRNKADNGAGAAMDNLKYEYRTDKPNQLLRVEDSTGNNGDASGAEDIANQEGENYIYNTIGQLVEDWEYVTAQERIDFNDFNILPQSIIYYIYNAAGLVTQVKKGDQPVVTFFYNDRGHRVRKESYANGIVSQTTTYVRDVSGSVMAVYTNNTLQEHPVYGASRLGVHYRQSNSTTYELTDHLGNVRAAFAVTGGTVDTKNATDYYPFGMPMPNRNMQGDYRYAYQGQEKDTETGKEAFQLRLWDSRIGRWLTTDPAGQYSSPYLGMGNNPINGVDSDGAFWEELGNWISGSGWNSNAALDFQANGGTLGEWTGDNFSGYRNAGSTINGEFVGTRFKAVNDFWNYDAFNFEGRVAFGQLNQFSGDVDNGFGIGGAVNWTKTIFLGGDYGNYWYTYEGVEGGFNGGLAFGASGDYSTEFFIAVYQDERVKSPSPKTFAGSYGSVALNAEIHEGFGVSGFGSSTASGKWRVFSLGAGIGIGGNLKVSSELRVGTSVLTSPTLTPTNERGVWDIVSNKMIHITPFY